MFLTLTKYYYLKYLLSFFPLIVLAFTAGNAVQESYPVTNDDHLPADGPNQPVGTPKGIKPGRVVWVWDRDATNENCRSTLDKLDWYWKPENTNGKVVGSMFRNALTRLTGDSTVTGSWNNLFHYFNSQRSGGKKGYSKGEKIFIKINQGQARWILTQEEKTKGYYLPEVAKPSDEKRRANLIPIETGPYLVLELLRELVNGLGVEQSDIAVGDPFSHIYGHNYEVWVREFPNIIYIDRGSAMHGRTLVAPSENNLIFFSDKSFSDRIYSVVEKADYIINVANLRSHGAALISLTAKNHCGSITSPTAKLLHYTHLAKGREGAAYEGYYKYRALVDLMGSKYLGQNTMLHIVDGLFGGGSDETKGPVKYFMDPFNNDWCNSIFLSQDQVAIESVCYDFLRAEWNGINRHDPVNSEWEIMPDRNGIDDYLHQAADPANWPEGIIYDPDNCGKPIPSLGVHEHWNDPVRKQYSRNLGRSTGIELISIPANLVLNENPVF